MRRDWIKEIATGTRKNTAPTSHPPRTIADHDIGRLAVGRVREYSRSPMMRCTAGSGSAMFGWNVEGATDVIGTVTAIGGAKIAAKGSIMRTPNMAASLE
jgi:hypothetical protein